LQRRLSFPRSPIVDQSHLAAPVELDIESCRLVLLLLRVKSLFVLDLFAIIAAAIAGVLLRWILLAVFGTKVGFVVSIAAGSTLPACLLAFVDIL